MWSKILKLSLSLFLLFIACSNNDSHKITLIDVLNKIEKEYCFIKKDTDVLDVSLYNGWGHFMEERCGKKENIPLSLYEKCIENNKNYFFKETVPEKLLKQRKFFVLTLGERKPFNCSDDQICGSDYGAVFVLDFNSLDIIETPATKAYRKMECDVLK